MKLIDPKSKKNKKENQEPDITPDHLEQLKKFIKKAAEDAGENGVDILELMRLCRENKSGARFWQCFTDEHWISVANEIEVEYAATDPIVMLGKEEI